MAGADINNPNDKFSPYHNLTAYLIKGKKSEGFDDMIDFLCRSKIRHALTVNPTIYTSHMENFWSSAVYSTEQGTPQIKGTVDGKEIIITEAKLRQHLKLQDEGDAISYPRDVYMRTFVSIGYTGNQTEYTIEKALMGPKWKYLCHTLLQCISQKRSGWNQLSSGLASAVHGMITGAGFNFSHLILEGLRYNLQEGVKAQFFMYPRFLQEVFNIEHQDLSKTARIYSILGHKNNIFQSMRTVSSKFSGADVPLLSTMLNTQSAQGDSSANPADTDPTPSSSLPQIQTTVSLDRTPVHSTEDAQAHTSLSHSLIAQLEHRAPVAAKYTRKRGKRTPSSLASKAQTQANIPHSESQHSSENIIRECHIVRETPSEVSLLGLGSLPGSIDQPFEPFLSSLNLSVEEPDQSDVPSPTTTIQEVLIGLASKTPNPSSSPLEVHSGSIERVDVDEAVTTAGPSTDQEDSDNIIKTSTTATHGEGVSLETPFTERNPRRQETMGDGDAEARPTAPSRSKDSTTVDEDRLKLHNLELTARVAMLEAEMSKLRHQVAMHAAHKCPTLATPSLVSVGTQTDAYLSADATKKGEMVSMEEDTDSLDDWIQEQFVLQSSQYKPAFVQVHDLPAPDNEDEEISEDWQLVVRAVDEMLNDAEDTEQTNASFSILPQAAAIISHTSAPHFPLTSTQLEFDIILAWGYDGKTERFWIGREFSGVEELDWDLIHPFEILDLYDLICINNSSDLSADLSIDLFYDLMEDNLPNFIRLIKELKRVESPESSQAAERRLSPNNLQITRSSLLNEEEVLSLKRLLYKTMVKDLDVVGWSSNKSFDHNLLLSNSTSLTINTRDILQLPSDFLLKIYQLRFNICNINSSESQGMMQTVRAHLVNAGWIEGYESVSNSDTDSNSSSPRVDINSAAYGLRSSIKDQLREITDHESQTNQPNVLSLSISEDADEAEAEIPTVPQSTVAVISEARAEASNFDKGKGTMTKEDEERLLKEKKEKEERRRKREEEEMAEEMAYQTKHQERKTALLLRQQTIQLYAKQLDEMKVKIHAGSQVEEDEKLARQLQEKFAKEEEEENEKKKKEDAKFRITDSKLAKELREEWTEALISQGEDADYLEKLSNKEIYRAFMGQQGQLASKKKAEEEEKAKLQSKKTIALNKRTHEERKVMIDFLKARGDSGRRLGPMNFMNLQALYFKVKKDEEERLGKKGSKKRVLIKEEEKPKTKKPKPSPSPTSSSVHHPSTLLPKPSTPPPNKSKSPHPAPTHQQPPLKKSKSSSKPEDSRDIVEWVYNPQGQRFEIFRGRTERRRSTYRSVDEVLQLPDSDLRRILELGEAHEPANERGKHLMLAIRHYFNPSKDVVMDIKPLKSHSPFVSWSYNADLDEFTLTDAKKQQMRCSSKAIFKMQPKDIKTLSELPLNNPSKDPRGYEVERIVRHMQKLQQQSD
ncbi:hypothetical protein L1987_30410 [Smallanthus sonchifolius]|uniref:Uncharacterized protein n=1 Tax=Smallanthus sonchifolius TaxID=185202 RepID=A0ACB9I4I2_9ASTR|nr:hypothetical protein L1987_30410 [Smallanthus sonchifolius]